MSDEPTAWEDINPPATVSAPRPAPLSRSLERLEPASNDDFRNELTACLALVAPVGMTEEARRDWLIAAWGTLGHLPPDLLKLGCKRARETCDHPSKIVPTIMEATNEWMGYRRQAVRDETTERIALPKPSYCTPEEARKIMEEFGIKPSWRP